MQSVSISRQPAGTDIVSNVEKSSVSQIIVHFAVVNSKITPPEFGAVCVDFSKHEIKGEFQKYLRPVEDPVLSQYCKDLTGITQSDVDNGILLEDALMAFHRWLKSLVMQEKASFIFYGPERNALLFTWSNNDLDDFLKNECRRKGIPRRDYFLKWVDAQELYMVCIISNGPAVASTNCLQFLSEMEALELSSAVRHRIT